MVWRNTILTTYNLNVFAKNKQGIPAIIKLCSKLEYRHLIDWWVHKQLKEDKNSFIAKIRSDRSVAYENIPDVSDACILFYFATICRLKKSINKLDLKSLGIDKNNVQNSTNRLGALFYDINFIENPEITSNKQNLKLLSLYKSIENILCYVNETDKKGFINTTQLKDPVFNITPGENSRFMKDRESTYLRYCLRGDTNCYETQVDKYQK